uniref:Putative secreted protein n=1 Tax=Anopheles triannulatus TaxID=58253 RepID=A0A2M4B356_9DIPT
MFFVFYLIFPIILNGASLGTCDFRCDFEQFQTTVLNEIMTRVNRQAPPTKQRQNGGKPTPKQFDRNNHHQNSKMKQ